MSESQIEGWTPKTLIQKAYEQCLYARWNYNSAIAENVEDEYLELYHRELHKSVLHYYDSMKYLLKNKRHVTEYWEGEPPSTEGQSWDKGKGFLDVHIENRKVKNKKELGELEDKIPHYCKFDVVGVDSKGMAKVMIQIPVYGLKKLDGQWNKQTRVQRKSVGMTGIKNEIVQEPELLDPAVLKNAANALDEAAEALGLLVSIEEEPPTDEPTMKDLRGLLVDRGQYEAAKNLPGNGEIEEENEGGEDE